MEIAWHKGTLSVREGNIGWTSIAFELNGVIWDGSSEEQRFEIGKRGNGIIVKRFVRGPMTIRSLSDYANFQINGALRYYHSSNVRTESYPVSTQEGPLIRPLPLKLRRFNDGEGNQFPAFALFDKDYDTLLIEGDLDQTRLRRIWELNTSSRRAIESYDLASECLSLSVGEELEVSCVYYEILHNTHVQNAFQGYINALREKYHFAVANSAMIHGGVYCTWNYGTKEKINEALILQRAASLAVNLPECTHFLIDDGYQANRLQKYAGIDSFYPDPGKGYNKQLFPSGMKFLSNSLKKLNLKPAIWLAPSVYLDSPLAYEHPEWLMRDADGNPDLIENTTYLDLSIPDAYAFMLSILDTVFCEWGFEGLKFDYMTQYFTLEKARFHHGSGCEWRDRLFSEIRNRIGPAGLFMTCIAMSMGNPFPGRFADCYRCGRDIHDGTKCEQIAACKSTLPQVLLPGKELFLLNMDSIGFGSLPFNEQHFRFVWVFITQGVLEFGGAVESLSQAQFAWFRKLFRKEGRGNKVECLDEQAFTEYDLPRILRSGRFTAYFNWDNRKTVRFQHSSGNTLFDYFSEKAYPEGSIILQPFSAALIEEPDFS